MAGIIQGEQVGTLSHKPLLILATLRLRLTKKLDVDTSVLSGLQSCSHMLLIS